MNIIKDLLHALKGEDHAISSIPYKEQLPIEELRNPRSYKWATQNTMVSSEDTSLVADGMGKCFPVLLKGKEKEAGLIHVEGGGVDGRVLRSMEDFIRRNSKTEAIIIKGADTYPASQMIEQLQRRGVAIKQHLDVDVGGAHFSIAYRLKENKIYFENKKKQKVLVFKGF